MAEGFLAQPTSLLSQLSERTSTRALMALTGLGGRIFFRHEFEPAQQP
jgi:hypothetical protein